VDSVAFWLLVLSTTLWWTVFFVGDVLMSARLIIIGVFAMIDRLRKRRKLWRAGFMSRGCGADSRVQRGEGDRADGPVGAACRITRICGSS
jgi:hypothetical protein